MSASEDKGASHSDQHDDHGHANDHGHDLYTVPPFVADDSLHDKSLSFLSLLTSLAFVGLMIYWAGLPLANVEHEEKGHSEHFGEAPKPGA